MKLPTICFCLAALIGSDTIAAERLPTLPKRVPYSEARETLLALGWQPLKFPNADVCDQDDARCDGFAEMHFCSGTGLARCGFTWKRGEGPTIIEVITIGEEEAFVSHIECRVNCPNTVQNRSPAKRARRRQ